MSEQKQEETQLEHRAASVESINEEERTVDVIWATNTPVKRWHPSIGDFFEVLDMRKSAVDVRRLNAGAPFLNAHSGSLDARSVMAAVVSGTARVEEERGLATLIFDTAENDPDADKVFRKIKRKILNGVSVGYRVLEMTQTKEAIGDVPVYRVTKWVPYEISVAPIPADIMSKFRSLKVMPEAAITEARDDATVERAAVTTEASQATEQTRSQQAAIAKKERDRIAAINTSCRAAKLPQSFSDQLINDSVPQEQAMQRIVEEMVRADAALEKPAPAIVTDVNEIGLDASRAGISNAIQARAGFDKLSEQGREFAGMSILEMARDYLGMRGIKTRGLSPADLAQTALGLRTTAGHTTSDFPEILGDVANKRLASAYEEAPATYRPIARFERLRDFKPTKIVTFGDAPALRKIVEGGEYTQGTVSEKGEVYQLMKYGRRFVYSWEMMVNDDLETLTRMPGMFARRARELESDLAWAPILSNANMGDNVALFHSTHGNLGAGAAFGEATLSDGRKKMRVQKGLDGAFLNITPKYLAGGPDLETAFDKQLVTITPTKTDDVNVFSRKLTPIIEPRITSATGHYLFADPNQVDVLVCAYLLGENGPVMDTRVGFDVDGYELKCRLVFAAKVADHRGVYYNPGA